MLITVKTSRIYTCSMQIVQHVQLLILLLFFPLHMLYTHNPLYGWSQELSLGETNSNWLYTHRYSSAFLLFFTLIHKIDDAFIQSSLLFIYLFLNHVNVGQKNAKIYNPLIFDKTIFQKMSDWRDWGFNREGKKKKWDR